MLQDAKYSQQVKCLSFAYNQKDGTDTDIKLDNKMSILYDNKNMGGNTVTYREKMELLSNAFKACFDCEDECECGFWICDFSDDFIIYRDYKECKYYKVKKIFDKEDGILAFHAFQSFKPNEVTPDKAHLIGLKLAEEMWGDKYNIVLGGGYIV